MFDWQAKNRTIFLIFRISQLFLLPVQIQYFRNQNKNSLELPWPRAIECPFTYIIINDLISRPTAPKILVFMRQHFLTAAAKFVSFLSKYIY